VVEDHGGTNLQNNRITGYYLVICEDRHKDDMRQRLRYRLQIAINQLESVATFDVISSIIIVFVYEISVMFTNGF
jgi:hypothetical protein